MATDDMTLLEQWRAGDLKAGDTLIRRHYSSAFRIAKRRLGRDDAAAEATQRALTTVVQKRDEIETDFGKYLRKVVYFSILTQTKQRNHDPLDAEDPGAGTPVHGASTMMAKREEEKLVVKALRSMSIDDQLVFYYDFVSDKSRTEIAELLEISKTQIYKRVSKAKQRLQAMIETFRDSPVRQSTLGGLESWLASVHRKAPTDES